MSATNEQRPDRKESDRSRVSGISAAALEGAREGDAAGAKSLNPGDLGAKLAQPGPGMTNRDSADDTPGSVSSSNEQTGITGGIVEDEGDADEEPRSATASDGEEPIER
jgi:hypothetical protein